MLYKVKELVFGLNEFEKTKIELRFEMINNSLTNINLNQLRDFEVLEEIIYKIKDQLRVKSSNLNKIILNPSKKLRKKDVLEILEKLNKIKYNFLEQAFTYLGNTPKPVTQTQEKTISSPSSQSQFETQVETQIDKEEVSQNELSKPDQTLKQVNIIENSQYKITLENEKVPYILISFENEVDFALLKTIGAIFFDSYNMHGTNIIIEKKMALIIPRLMDDNLLELTQNQRDINNDFEKIIEEIKRQNQQNSTEQIQEKSKEPQEQNSEEDKYIELGKKPEFKKSSKNDDMSLDALLSEEKNPKFIPKPNPKEDNENIIFSKSDPIEFEKKEIIEEVKEEDKIKIETQKKQTTPQNHEQNKELEISLNLDAINPKYIIYKDDKIVTYLEENSKVLGEIIIQPISGETVKKINENDLSYMMIFSKIFSSILFESLEAHGTNLIFDYEKNFFKIVVRYQNDQIPLKWDPKEESDSFLEDLRGKLLEKMHSALGGENASENKNQTQSKVQQEPKKPTKLSQEKAKHILDSMRRIP